MAWIGPGLILSFNIDAQIAWIVISLVAIHVIDTLVRFEWTS